jgi:hypothetical protein
MPAPQQLNVRVHTVVGVIAACLAMALLVPGIASAAKTKVRPESANSAVLHTGKVKAKKARRTAKHKPRANSRQAKKPRAKRRTTSGRAITFNITNERYELIGCWYWNRNYNRVCSWNYYDAGGYLTNRVEEYQYWNGYRYVGYAQYWCSTGGSGVCYRSF